MSHVYESLRLVRSRSSSPFCRPAVEPRRRSSAHRRHRPCPPHRRLRCRPPSCRGLRRAMPSMHSLIPTDERRSNLHFPISTDLAKLRCGKIASRARHRHRHRRQSRLCEGFRRHRSGDEDGARRGHRFCDQFEYQSVHGPGPTRAARRWGSFAGRSADAVHSQRGRPRLSDARRAADYLAPARNEQRGIAQPRTVDDEPPTGDGVSEEEVLDRFPVSRS